MFNRQPLRSPSFPPPPPRRLRISDARLTIVTSRVSSGLPATSRLKRRALIKKALCMCVCVCLVFENRRNQEKGIEKGINKRMEGTTGSQESVSRLSREVERRKVERGTRGRSGRTVLSLNRFHEDLTNLFASRTSNRISVSHPTINRRSNEPLVVSLAHVPAEIVRVSFSLFSFFSFHLRS